MHSDSVAVKRQLLEVQYLKLHWQRAGALSWRQAKAWEGASPNGPFWNVWAWRLEPQ